jgi:hypothetical protein
MSGEALGRKLLRLDALYCAGAGLIALVLSAPLADLFGIPRLLLVVAGIATLAWATLLRRLAGSLEWRAPVAIVAVANVAAAGAIAVLAVVGHATAARLLLAAVAIEVCAFGAGQVAALRRSA